MFRVGVYPLISSILPQSGPVGTTVTINGQNFGATQVSGSTVTFGGVTATPTSWSDTKIVAAVPQGAPTTSNIYVATTAGSSNGSYFNVTPSPSISAISPSSASVGTSVNIMGANFGASQGTSTVKFNGTAAIVTSWSDTSLIANVPSGATSGNVVVTVGTASSNTVAFTIVAPPMISATAFPAPNAGGWNNTNVYVTFTCTPGGLPIATCPAPQVVSTEGASQVVSGTVTDTSGDSATASITLNIERTPPALTVSSPADQFVSTSPNLTLSGTASNSVTTVNSVACNGVTAATASGAFSCNLSLNPGVNLVMVRAADVAGNVSAVRLHVTYAVALPAPASLQISPASANVLVGSTQQFTAVDDQGRPRTDATWTVDNSSLATITADSSPILTGVAAGTATLTATVGGVSAQIQVNILAGTSLPVGTVLWSAPATTGFTVHQIAQAVPSVGGPDLYSIEIDSNNTPLVRSLTADGQQLWTAQFPSGSFANPGGPVNAMPDGNGGILMMRVTTPGAIPQTYQMVDLDAQTGTQLWSYDLASDYFALPQTGAIRGDGTIFKMQGVQGKPALIGIDPNTGATTFLYKPPDSTYAFLPGIPNCPSTVTGTAPSTLSPPTVGPDGTVYSVVSQFNLTLTDGCDLGPLSYTLTNSLLQVAPDGSTSLTQLRQDVSNQTYNGGSFAGFFYLPGNSSAPLYQPIPTFNGFHVIPDGQGGVLVPYGFALTANYSPSPFQGRVTHMASGGALNDFSLPLVPLAGTVLGENATAFATDGYSVASFNTLSGQTSWSYRTQVPSTQFSPLASILAATAGGGVVVNDPQAGLVSIDPSGTATGFPGTTNIDATPLNQGDWIAALNSLSSAVVELAGPDNMPADSGWFTSGGASQKQNAAVAISIRVSCSPPSPCPVSQGDNLKFANTTTTCSEDLGVHYCPNSQLPGWYWSVEVKAQGLDDATAWTINQTVDSGQLKGMGRNAQGVLVPFAGPLPPGPDGPNPVFLQQISGQKNIFYSDGPGQHTVVTSQKLQVDSATFVLNLSAHLCRKDKPSICQVFPWFTKIIVKPGASLDEVNSTAGPGKASTKF